METQVQSNCGGCFLWRCSAPKHCTGIEHFSSGNFECFKSTKEASDQLLEALQDDSCNIIGLHGMRGSGKTKLVKAVGEKAKFLKIFYKVVFVTASQYFLSDIQSAIANQLVLPLYGHESSDTRASKISVKLQSKKRILLILDDVRITHELKHVGIPTNTKECKVVLTTCHQQVCTLMKCHREIPLHPLSKEETWKLFKKHSEIDEENGESLIPSILLELALRRKPIEEWEATLDGLRHASARYQVFLSFRGEDTRFSFTGFLYDALCREGFKTFMDDGELKGGDHISQSLIAAVEASRLSIIVLSENYAYSSWCLDELVTILECMKKKGQLVWPIFYKVNPTDVRHQRNSYGEAMEAHEKRFGSEKVKEWRSALSEVAGLSGDHYKDGYEYQFIQKIVAKVHDNKSRLLIQNTID